MKKIYKMIPILILLIVTISVVGYKKFLSKKVVSKSTSEISQNVKKQDKDEKEINDNLQNHIDKTSINKDDNKKNKDTVLENKDDKNDSKSKVKNDTEKKTQESSKNKSSNSLGPPNIKNKNTFTLIVGKDTKGYMGNESKIILKKQIPIKDNKSAMTYLRENVNIKDKGGFIYEVNGMHNLFPIPVSKKTERQKKLKIMGIDWFIYLNGSKTSVGVNDLYPKVSDEVLLDLHEWDKREFK